MNALRCSMTVIFTGRLEHCWESSVNQGTAHPPPVDRLPFLGLKYTLSLEFTQTYISTLKFTVVKH